MTTRCPAPNSPLPALVADDLLAWTDYVVRIYAAGGPFATTWNAFRRFGPVSSMRFDHQPPPRRPHPTRGVIYGAGRWASATGFVDPLEVAVLESFPDGVVDRRTNDPRLVVWKPERSLRLLQLSDSSWLARAHGNAALLTGARGVARMWSRAVYREYPNIDGLIWSSSVLQSGRSIMLYERADDGLPAAPSSDRPLTEKFLQPALARIAGQYGLTLM